MKTDCAVIKEAMVEVEEPAVEEAVVEKKLKNETETQRAESKRIPDAVADELLAFLRESENPIHE